MRDLPSEFSGSRTFEELVEDLRSIVGRRVFVTVVPLDREWPVVELFGELRPAKDWSGNDQVTMPGLVFGVGEAGRFALYAADVEQVQLRTYDGTDYFRLEIDGGSYQLRIKDEDS